MTDHWSLAAQFTVLPLFGRVVITQAPKALIVSDLDLAKSQHTIAGLSLHVRAENGALVIYDDFDQAFVYRVFEARAGGMTHIEYLCFQPEWMPGAGEAVEDEDVDFVVEAAEGGTLGELDDDEGEYDTVSPYPDVETKDAIEGRSSYAADHVTVFYPDREALHFDRITEAQAVEDFDLVLEDVYGRLIVVTNGWTHFICEEQNYGR